MGVFFIRLLRTHEQHWGYLTANDTKYAARRSLCKALPVRVRSSPEQMTRGIEASPATKFPDMAHACNAKTQEQE